MIRAALLLLSAALLGASGLGLEVLSIDLAGLPLGYGRAGPLALALFIAGWAGGARWASHPARRPAARALRLGLWLAAAAAFMPHAFVALADTRGPFVWALCMLLVLAIAVPQGAFMPMLARGLGPRADRDLAGLFASNLGGAALGAWLFGSLLPAAGGRATAALGAGLCALCGAALAAGCLRGKAASPTAEVTPAPVIPLRLAAAVALVTAWAASLEWFGLRLAVLWLGGMQQVLGSVLLASLLALALGAALLPRLLPRSRNGLALLAGLCCLSSLSYFFLPFWLAGSEHQPLLWRCLRLVGPCLLPFGAWIPLLQRELAGERGERLGALLGHEALGALLGLPLMHFLVLPHLGLGGSLLAMLALASVALLVWGARPVALVAVASCGMIVGWGGLTHLQPALQSPALQNPAFEFLSFEEDEHFAISVVQDGLLGERTLLTDGFRAAAGGAEYAYMRALAHLPLLLHPEPRRVAVLAFGTGTTAGAVALHSTPNSIDVLELSGRVTANAHWFEEVNRQVLEDPRVQVILGDGRKSLRERRARYDVLTMEPLLPDSPFAVYLYTPEFYAIARRSLAPGGLVCQWVPPHALEPASFEALLSAFTGAFEWSGIWVFGSQVILLGGALQPSPSSARFPQADGDLRRALGVLGLQDVQGVLARFVCDGAHWPRAKRAVTDLDPWVIYAPRRTGAVLLSDLPLNLARLRAHAQPLPTEWWLALGPDGSRRLEALALLREARESFEAVRARNALEPLAAGGDARAAAALGELQRRASVRDVEALLREAHEREPGESGLLRFEQTLEFQSEIRLGFGLLARADGQEAAAQAAVHLTRAAVLRPERADVHAYLALALQRLGSKERSQREIDQARRLCPQLAATAVGRRLGELGFE